MTQGNEGTVNRNARIVEGQVAPGGLEVTTAGRDTGTLEARVEVRQRTDVETGRSLTGLAVRTASGRTIRFTGAEARTLFRVLDRAVNG